VKPQPKEEDGDTDTSDDETVAVSKYDDDEELFKKPTVTPKKPEPVPQIKTEVIKPQVTPIKKVEEMTISIKSPGLKVTGSPSMTSPRSPRQVLDDDLDEVINELEDNKPSMLTYNFEHIKSPFKRIHVDQLQDLAEVWGANETVRKASMKGKGVDGVVLSYMCSQLNFNLTLEEWDLSDNPDIDDTAVKPLEVLISKNKTIEKLDLRGSAFSEKGKKTLMTAKQNNSKLELLL
jgi:hypothetical protein